MDTRGAVWLPEHMARGSMQRLPRPPSGNPGQYKTYALQRPRGTHFEDATCEEYECEQYEKGFTLHIDTSTEMGRSRFHYVTHDRTRSYRMERTGHYTFSFHYGPGNDGFAHKHKLPLDRPPRALVIPGDWRGQTGETRVHSRVEDWVDDSLNHHDRIQTIRNRG
jgi:hypothetical protein